jgi:hypothetical protein
MPAEVDAPPTAAPVHVRKESARIDAYSDRTLGVIFLVFAVLSTLMSASSAWMPPPAFGLAWPVFMGLLAVFFLFQGLAIMRRAGLWLRVGSLGGGLGSLILSPLLVQEGLQDGTPWLSVSLVVLGVVFAPVGVLGLWHAYRGGFYRRRLHRTVTFDELVGR